MKNKIFTLIKKYEETIRYLLCGGLTVVVNTVLYMLLVLFLDDLTANTVAFILSVLFAYVTNCIFVFQQKTRWVTFVKFIGMRIGTIVIDNGGMWIMLSLEANRLLSKCIVNIVIIVINYLLSKFLIFTKGKGRMK